MHKININLHNLKTALIFSMEISRDFVSTWFTYVPNYIIFRRSAAEIRGGLWNPPHSWSYFSYSPPPPPLEPIGAALGTAVNRFNSSHKKVSEHYITWLFYMYIVCQDLEMMFLLWNVHGFGPWGPFPWASMGFSCTSWTTLNPLLLRMIPAKFD